MKQLVKRKIYPKLFFISSMVMSFLAAPIPCYAAPGDQDPDAAFNATITFIAGWVNKFGFAIAFVGAIMFAMGFRNDDAEGKTRGIRTLVAGFIVAAVSLKPVYNGIFGLGN